MSLPDFYGPEVEAHQIPQHAEAAIGPVALEHRAKILNEILPRIASALRVYDCAVRVCFYDPEANNNARRELSEAIRDLDRVDLLMLQCSPATPFRLAKGGGGPGVRLKNSD